MAKYRVKELSFIDGQLVYPGAEIEYGGIASANLELIASAKEAAKIASDNKEAIALEAISLNAVRLDADGKPTKVPIDGSEDLESIQASLAAAKQLHL